MNLRSVVFVICLMVGAMGLLHCGGQSAGTEVPTSPADGQTSTEVTQDGAPQKEPPQADAGPVDTAPQDSAATDTTQSFPDPPPTTFGGNRPVKIKVPEDYDAKKAYPLLIVLHGYSASGAVQEFYLGVTPLVEREKVLVLSPDGTQDVVNNRFWNASDACCDFADTGVDDVAYIKGLISDVKKAYHIDAKRVYLLGHSNGGFMSYRMACDAADQIAAIASLAGATQLKQDACQPSEPVSVLQVHGTSDGTIKYPGGEITVPNFQPATGYPSAKQSVEYWGKYNKCTGPLGTVEGKLDLDTSLAGDETEIQSISGCPTGIDVRLWTIQKGEHLPKLNENFINNVWKWFQAHPKP